MTKKPENHVAISKPLGPTDDTKKDPFFAAAFDLRRAMDAFKTGMSLAMGNLQIDQGGAIVFQFALALVNLEESRAFRKDMLTCLQEIVERTRAVDGAIDPRAIQAEMSRRRVDLALGPDVETLQQMSMAANHATYLESKENETLKVYIADLKTHLLAAIDAATMPTDAKPVQVREALREQIEEMFSLGSQGIEKSDPGAIENAHLFGGT